MNEILIGAVGVLVGGYSTVGVVLAGHAVLNPPIWKHRDGSERWHGVALFVAIALIWPLMVLLIINDY